MAYKCTICGKHSTSGNTISHSHHKTKRKFKPNLQKINIVLEGQKQKVYVCSKCIKNGKVEKAI